MFHFRTFQVGKNLELLYSHNNDDVLKAIECIRKISTKGIVHLHFFIPFLVINPIINRK